MAETPAGISDAAAAENGSPPGNPRLRFAVKTALALTLAYLIPMAMAWPQPQTAAITVMLIAAGGAVSESLQKGVLRIVGTVAGAIIGLGLVAAFPQERMLYLLSASCAVALLVYLHSAYRGDKTAFMLAAVVTLMVFNGGDAEGAFLYGIDRTYMTILGVVTYTLVASFLWPVKVANNSRALAANLARELHRAFDSVVDQQTDSGESKGEALASLVAAQNALETQLSVALREVEEVKAYRGEWRALAENLRDLGQTLLPALQDIAREAPDYPAWIGNHEQLRGTILTMFTRLDALLADGTAGPFPEPVAIEFARDRNDRIPVRTLAAVAARAELLEQLQTALTGTRRILGILLLDEPGFATSRDRSRQPRFLWLDPESFKTAARAFLSFWMATAIWILFNPPGGFTFVTLATVLIPLVSYTPVTPRLLVILLSLGFFFALPAYVFLLSAMTHWLQLALFLFGYALFGFYIFQGPVSIFFLLGLFVLGIQNTMSYHVDVILVVALTFYLVCALLVISVNVPFSSRPERLYPTFSRRFFRHCAWLIHGLHRPDGPPDWQVHSHQLRMNDLVLKMSFWGARIDSNYFDRNDAEALAALNRCCEVMASQIESLYRRKREMGDNALLERIRWSADESVLASLCASLAEGGVEQIEEQFSRASDALTEMEQHLDYLLGDESIQQYAREEIAEFFTLLHLQAALADTIIHCRDHMRCLDLDQLGENRF